VATPSETSAEQLELSLNCPADRAEAVASVEYWGFYEGFDENGNRLEQDWHGFTKDQRPEAIIGLATVPPFGLTWDLSMIPDQEDDLRVRAAVHFKDPAEIVYHTPPATGLSIPGRTGHRVSVHSLDPPRSMWSRDNNLEEGQIEVDIDPERIEQVQLHVCIWDGGKGGTPEPFTLNGHPLPVAGEGRHDLIYRTVDVPPQVIKKGMNQIRLLSDTKHHGIEVMLPGPALIIRERTR
jgi:hypothetical protein